MKTTAKLKKDLWKLCKQIIRHKHPNICYTCGKSGLEGSNWHTGHGKPKSILALQYQYDLRNLRPQCMACNTHHGGMTDIFIAKLEREKEGKAFLQEACIKKDGVWILKGVKLMGGAESRKFILNLIEEYEQIISNF